jgi:hypothetical protein
MPHEYIERIDDGPGKLEIPRDFRGLRHEVRENRQWIRQMTPAILIPGSLEPGKGVVE